MKLDLIRYLNEMASFSVNPAVGLKIPCHSVKTPGMPCQDTTIGAIDMRFEGPPSYPAPFNTFNNGSKFLAPLPGTKDFLAYHGGGFGPPTGIVSSEEADQLGYPVVPEDWVDKAEFYDTNYNVVKPALGDFSGERQAAFSGGR